MILVEQVLPGSPAEELGVVPGDHLLAVNNLPPADFLDLALAEREGLQSLELKHGEETWELQLDLEPGELSGLVLEQPVPMICGNRCLFCFVHQLPKGMRKSLYIKDEDYRYSYLHGAYITLSNMNEEGVSRILSRQLSPLYISVHATDEKVRERLLGRSGNPILPQLKKLTDAGIKLHTQIVACPGINDGTVLDQSIRDLEKLSPHILSLAIVAVGLTGHRKTLPSLAPFERHSARAVLRLIEEAQERNLASRKSRFVWPVDEFYLLAEERIPPREIYEDLPQIENGVGLLAVFEEEAQEVLTEAHHLGPLRVTLLTGESAFPTLKRFSAQLSQITGAHLRVQAIKNRFFSGETSVAGLITGSDILSQVHSLGEEESVLVPDVMLRQDAPVFLDDVTLEELSHRLQREVVAIASDPWGILDALEHLSEGGVPVVRV